MNSTAIASSAPRSGVAGRPNPLTRVVTWELRRFIASRVFWIQAVGFFFFMLVIMWSLRAADQFTNQTGRGEITGFVAGTSAWGLLNAIPTCLVLLVLVLPFITADGVTRDLQRRTHELLMTTVVPVWAYVWGRYLTGLLMSLGLAVLMLVAMLGMGLLLHITVADYPAPATEAMLLLWIAMVVPATILVASVGFTFATLVPSMSTPIKVVILVAWIVGALVIPTGLRDTTPPNWYVNWDPTSVVTSIGLRSQYSALDLLRTATSETQFQNAFVGVENKLPVVGWWFTSHLLLGGLGLLLVIVVPFAFKRSRDVL